MHRLALALCAVLALAGCEKLVERQIVQGLTRADTAMLESPDLQVVLCGTGSPLPDPKRAAACTAVIAGGKFVLVDAGPGSWETVDLANLPIGSLSAVLITHFHSDHIGDLGEAITQSWIAGRAQPLDVYGPPGVSRIVDGLREVYAFDVDHRVAHHGEQFMPREAAGAVAHEIALPPEGSTEAVLVGRFGELEIRAFRVDHAPVSEAIGYRFDWRGRSVVISGDTRASKSLLENARGADLLVHEALQPAITEQASRVAKRLGRERVAKLASDIAGYHTSPREAAEIAKSAGVKQLVLTHLVPAPNNVIARRLFLEGTSGVFDGEIVLGEDGMRFALAPRAPD
jgi:ribonuclease Z